MERNEVLASLLAGGKNPPEAYQRAIISLTLLLQDIQSSNEDLKKQVKIYRAWLIFTLCMSVPSNLIIYGVLEGWQPSLIVALLGVSLTIAGAVAKFFPD